MLVFRKRDTGETYLPHVNRNGHYVLGDPKNGKVMHHAKFKVFASTLEEAVALVESRGFYLWMKGQTTNQTNLISPGEIEIVR